MEEKELERQHLDYSKENLNELLKETPSVDEEEVERKLKNDKEILKSIPNFQYAGEEYDTGKSIRENCNEYEKINIPRVSDLFMFEIEDVLTYLYSWVAPSFVVCGILSLMFLPWENFWLYMWYVRNTHFIITAAIIVVPLIFTLLRFTKFFKWKREFREELEAYCQKDIVVIKNYYLDTKRWRQNEKKRRKNTQDQFNKYVQELQITAGNKFETDLHRREQRETIEAFEANIKLSDKIISEFSQVALFYRGRINQIDANNNLKRLHSIRKEADQKHESIATAMSRIESLEKYPELSALSYREALFDTIHKVRQDLSSLNTDS